MSDIANIKLENITYGLKDVAARNGSINVRKFASVSDLTASDIVSGSIATTAGFYSAGDGGAANYRIRAKESGETANNKDTFDVNGLIAELIVDEEVSVKCLGAKGDNLTDDAAIINYAVSNYKNVKLSNGNYLIESSISIPTGVTLIGEDGAKIVSSFSAATSDAVSIVGDKVTIKNITVTGNARYGVSMGGNNGKLINCTVSDITYSGVMVLGNDNIISGLIGIENGWDAVSNYGTATNVIIENSFAYRCKRHGFSTDPTVKNIVFKNCYAENIGNPSLTEGHSAFHLEGSIDCQILNCKAYYDGNHLANTTAASGNEYFGFRIYGVSKALIDGLTVEFANGFAPLNTAFAGSISNQSFNEDNVTITNSYFVNNTSSTSVGQLYINNSQPSIYNTYFKDVHIAEQDSYLGFPRRFIDNTIVLNYKTSFAFFKYLCENAIFARCRFKGNGNLAYMLKGHFVNCNITECLFDTGTDSIILSSESGNYNVKSRNTNIIRCTFKDFTRLLYLEFIDNMTNVIDDCLFEGTCTTVIQANYNSAKMINCKKYNLTYTNLSDGVPYFDVFDDLSTTYDFTPQALNPSKNKYNISVDAGGNVIATAI